MKAGNLVKLSTIDYPQLLADRKYVLCLHSF